MALTAQALLKAMGDTVFSASHDLYYLIRMRTGRWNMFEGRYYAHIYDGTYYDGMWNKIYLIDTEKPSNGKGWELKDIIPGIQDMMLLPEESKTRHFKQDVASYLLGLLSIEEISDLIILDSRYQNSWLVRQRLLAGK